MALILKQYKLPNGEYNYPALFSIPSEERIPVLAAKDFDRCTMLIIGAITMAFKSLQLKKGLNEIQILDISEAIIDSSVEDNLGLEDLVLFLQGLVRGRYGTSFENINTPKFLELFEIYRQERHEKMLQINYEQHIQFKSLGDEFERAKNDPLSEHLTSFGERISDLKQNLKEL